jgi:hypothetical protein
MGDRTEAPMYAGCSSDDTSVVRLELCEGQTLTRADIDMVMLLHNQLISRIHELEEELGGYKK